MPDLHSTIADEHLRQIVLTASCPSKADMHDVQDAIEFKLQSGELDCGLDSLTGFGGVLRSDSRMATMQKDVGYKLRQDCLESNPRRKKMPQAR